MIQSQKNCFSTHFFLIDGTSNKFRSTLKVYDNDNGIQSCTFGSYCAVTNVITKMRFKQGTGDPMQVALSTFCAVKNENTKPGTVIRYVGNRFNVLFGWKFFF